LPSSTQQRVSQSLATEHSRAQLMAASMVVQIEPWQHRAPAQA
jgi:hypothetical protein